MVDEISTEYFGGSGGYGFFAVVSYFHYPEFIAPSKRRPHHIVKILVGGIVAQCMLGSIGCACPGPIGSAT